NLTTRAHAGTIVAVSRDDSPPAYVEKRRRTADGSVRCAPPSWNELRLVEVGPLDRKQDGAQQVGPAARCGPVFPPRRQGGGHVPDQPGELFPVEPGAPAAIRRHARRRALRTGARRARPAGGAATGGRGQDSGAPVGRVIACRACPERSFRTIVQG